MLFSVGDTGALDGAVGDEVVVVVVVDVVVPDGAWFPVEHAAVIAPSAMSATPPTRAIQSRGRRSLSIRITCSYARQAVPSGQVLPSPAE
jgi:hypothetical protein